MLKERLTKNEKLAKWLEEVQMLCQPEEMVVVDGSDEEYDRLCQLLVDRGSLIKLNEAKRPESYLARSAPEDVARVESRTFICSPKKEDAGPTNHWEEPNKMMEKMHGLFRGCMRGRTCYVIAFCMGPLGSNLAKIGVQVTDSPYVVINTRWMTRMGKNVWDLLDREEAPEFVPCWHSVGQPLSPGQEDSRWPCNPKDIHIVHFPHLKQIWSFGSGYGGNALLGKKCLALRIASQMAREEGWMAEHMLIMGVTNPQGEKKYIAAAFPSACGKTNLAMMKPTLPGWKVECVGDDIAWMRFDDQGRLRAVNPEAGFFGVAPGTSMKSNPVAMQAVSKRALFTNVALTDSKDIWWEGMDPPSEELVDWTGNAWDLSCSTPAAHPNARFTVSIEQCPSLDSSWDDPRGVVIDAIIFGGRRSYGMPLVLESFDWKYGTFFGAALSSEKTAAATGELGKLRHDPFAMLPFCGYHMGDYFAHWLSMEKSGRKMPKIFYVNWFAKDEEGKFLWPGFGENSRVIKWIFNRCEGKYPCSTKTAVGYLPRIEDLDIDDLAISQANLNELLQVNTAHWSSELQELREYFTLFGTHLPSSIQKCIDEIQGRLDFSSGI